jgi:ABC-type oligopeptide transport system ATPase subunit
MYKVAICGKAGSGKDTVAKIITKLVCPNNEVVVQLAFADPIKEIAYTMFPSIPNKYLYGSSKYRAEVIPNAYKDGKPLTVRQLLLDIGASGRAYNSNIWIDILLHRTHEAIKKESSLIVIADVRFKDEYEALRKLGFYQIKLYREDHTKIDHVSETAQDAIRDSQFGSILYNNGSLDELKSNVQRVIELLPNSQ